MHPLVLGETFRSWQQIRKLAEKLLAASKNSPKRIRKLVDFLCSSSGSHDYTINRREARELGMQVVKCSEELYENLRELSRNYSNLMKLREPIETDFINADESSLELTHSIIESEYGMSHLVSEYDIIGHDGRQVAAWRTFFGWKEK